MSADDYLDGAPELIVEIAASSAAIDLHDELRAYWRNGVQEYVVWQVLEHQVDWFELSEGEYRPLPATPAGILESRCWTPRSAPAKPAPQHAGCAKRGSRTSRRSARSTGRLDDWTAMQGGLQAADPRIGHLSVRRTARGRGHRRADRHWEIAPGHRARRRSRQAALPGAVRESGRPGPTTPGSQG